MQPTSSVTFICDAQVLCPFHLIQEASSGFAPKFLKEADEAQPAQAWATSRLRVCGNELEIEICGPAPIESRVSLSPFGQTLGLGSVAPTPPAGVSVIPQSLTEHLACRALGSTVTTYLCEGPDGFPEV